MVRRSISTTARRSGNSSARGISMDIALANSAYQGNVAEVRRQLDHGADPNYAGERGITALMWAVSGGHHDVAKMLLEHGANVHQTDEQGRTAVDWATGSESF